MRVLVSALIVLAIVPAAGHAQAALTKAVPVSVIYPAPENRAQATSGPTIESAAVGIRPTVSTEAAASPQRARRRSGMNSDVVLMVVGGATMLAGAVIGGDAGTIFMVGGGIIGLWGLYNFLQ